MPFSHYLKRDLPLSLRTSLGMSEVASLLCDYSHRRQGTELLSLGPCVTQWELTLFVMPEGGWACSSVLRTFF